MAAVGAYMLARPRNSRFCSVLFVTGGSPGLGLGTSSDPAPPVDVDGWLVGSSSSSLDESGDEGLRLAGRMLSAAVETMLGDGEAVVVSSMKCVVGTVWIRGGCWITWDCN